MSTPSISIVLPTYNRAHLVPRAVRSVLTQSDGDFSLLVIDDGSPDQTQAALAPFARDPRLRLLVNARCGGVSAARNRAVREADGEWIVFLDDDDELLPHYLERLRAMIAAQPGLGLVWSGAERVYAGEPERGEILAWHESWDGTQASQHRGLLHFSLCWGVAARRAALLAAGLFDERFICAEDIDLALRLVARGTPYATIAESLVRVHIEEGVSLSRTAGSHSPLRELLLQNNAAFLAAHPQLQAHYRRHAMSGYYRDGDRASARRIAAALLLSGPLDGPALEMVLRFELVEPLRRLLRHHRNH